jgi:hypothetical protein
LKRGWTGKSPQKNFNFQQETGETNIPSPCQEFSNWIRNSMFDQSRDDFPPVPLDFPTGLCAA